MGFPIRPQTARVSRFTLRTLVTSAYLLIQLPDSSPGPAEQEPPNGPSFSGAQTVGGGAEVLSNVGVRSITALFSLPDKPIANVKRSTLSWNFQSSIHDTHPPVK